MKTLANIGVFAIIIIFVHAITWINQNGKTTTENLVKKMKAMGSTAKPHQRI